MVISYHSFFVVIFFLPFSIYELFPPCWYGKSLKNIASAFLYLFSGQWGKLRLHGNLNLEKWNIPYISVLLTTNITVSPWIISINFIRKKLPMHLFSMEGIHTWPWYYYFSFLPGLIKIRSIHFLKFLI